MHVMLLALFHSFFSSRFAISYHVLNNKIECVRATAMIMWGFGHCVKPRHTTAWQRQQRQQQQQKYITNNFVCDSCELQVCMFNAVAAAAFFHFSTRLITAILAGSFFLTSSTSSRRKRIMGKEISERTNPTTMYATLLQANEECECYEHDENNTNNNGNDSNSI